MSIEYRRCRRGSSVVPTGFGRDVNFYFTPGKLYRICEITPRQMCLKDDEGILHILDLEDERFRDATHHDLKNDHTSPDRDILD